jgi:Mg2+ and Co2+ transporter CorA
MPELDWTLGYPFTIALLAVLDGWIWTWFKTAGWI